MKQQALVSKRESGSRFLNLPRPDRAETGACMLLPDDLSEVPTPNKGVQVEDIRKELSAWREGYKPRHTTKVVGSLAPDRIVSVTRSD